ncbi:D-alanyl-D-alanine carboxypeptidase [Clostridiaceae bacterium UIB06]|uniref:D-alanyl-D-alanine carboxypeptidase n=1 Tax=Clostridium thailandense TaxID=2794346 RepID=A0A949TV86_9CLOT|nr:D-alanyl-D-alanine carboxypeptidase family protein [Clostridium thailandense]MBV7273053.1 D-alanyl-D-alanine carboxypeptidase [Clostridium thailandense]MCH5135717.1 D-alanyl-D-alanine carboxypeptidase [Clostridiaceae bacterium UIB06]
MKKLITFLICFIVIFSNINYKVNAKDAPPTVSADSVVLMDALSGEILYAKNAYGAYPPASTTKLMTALLTLERTKLDDVVTVGKNPPVVDGSKIYLFEGEQIKVKDLLYGLLLCSGNDCAEALAEHISGSIDKFAGEMNKRALELGCKNTNFVNPSGLYDEKHKTSANDLALIMKELSKHPEYTQIATTSFYKIPTTNKSSSERPLWNENKLIQKSSSYYYEGCQGGKTGYTIQSQHSYVSCATRNGQTLIVALVHDKEKTFFPDAAALFNYGFNNFQSVRLFAKGDLVTTYKDNGLNIPLLAASDFYYVKEKGSNPTTKFNINDKISADKFFKQGDIIDEATISLDNKNIGSLKLISGTDHELKQVFQSNTLQSNFSKPQYIIPAGIVALAAIIFVLKKLKLFSRN